MKEMESCKKKEEPVPEPEPVAPAIEQKGTIAGKVRQFNAFGQTDTSFISGIKITLLPSGASTIAAATGSYSFTEVTAGTYTLMYEKSGSKPTDWYFIP